jgi:hypothetical protein
MAFYPHCNKQVKYTVSLSSQHCKTKKAEPWLYQVLSLLLAQRALLFFQRDAPARFSGLFLFLHLFLLFI